MSHERPTLAALPPGRWAVAVSGGADSVAALRLLLECDGGAVGSAGAVAAVIHLDHQTRGGASAADAAFVGDLAARLGVPFEGFRVDAVESRVGRPAGANPSARYRSARLACYREVAARHNLSGVALGHHADDQAETVLLRLLRMPAGGSAAGLAGMRPDAAVAGVRLARPALGVRRAALRGYLDSVGESWSEDSSNASPVYARNRVRRLLAADENLVAALLDVSAAAGRWAGWIEEAAPRLESAFETGRLADLPAPLADRSARRWLAAAGCPAADVSAATVAWLVAMAADVSGPPQADFPGRVRVRRRRGKVWAEGVKSEL